MTFSVREGRKEGRREGGREGQGWMEGRRDRGIEHLARVACCCVVCVCMVWLASLLHNL